jgi:hypothetical protein
MARESNWIGSAGRDSFIKLIRSGKKRVIGKTASNVYEEGKIMRGHIKLFMLQMNLERSRQPQNAAMAENVYNGTCRDAASSMQRIFLPSLKIISGR